MPWRRRGNVIQKKKGEHWVHHQTCRTVDKAKAALRLLKEKSGH